MSKRRRHRRKINSKEKFEQEKAQPVSWMARDGLHTLTPGEAPSAEEVAEMTKVYQEQIRNSPLWADMVGHYGEEGAEQILRDVHRAVVKKFRVEIR